MSVCHPWNFQPSFFAASRIGPPLSHIPHENPSICSLKSQLGQGMATTRRGPTAWPWTHPPWQEWPQRWCLGLSKLGSEAKAITNTYQYLKIHQNTHGTTPITAIFVGSILNLASIYDWFPHLCIYIYNCIYICISICIHEIICISILYVDNISIHILCICILLYYIILYYIILYYILLYYIIFYYILF